MPVILMKISIWKVLLQIESPECDIHLFIHLFITGESYKWANIFNWHPVHHLELILFPGENKINDKCFGKSDAVITLFNEKIVIPFSRFSPNLPRHFQLTWYNRIKALPLKGRLAQLLSLSQLTFTNRIQSFAYLILHLRYLILPI